MSSTTSSTTSSTMSFKSKLSEDLQEVYDDNAAGGIAGLLAEDAVLAAFVRHLRAVDLLILSLTSKEIRRRLSDVADASSLRMDRLPRCDGLEALYAMSRDLPGQYVCETCHCLHAGEAGGHAKDAKLVEKASKSQSRSVPAVDAQCQKKTQKDEKAQTTHTHTHTHTIQTTLARLVGSSTARPAYPEIPKGVFSWAQATDANTRTHTFAGSLSSQRRTPLAGLLYRDVQLPLKLVRMLGSDAAGKHRKQTSWLRLLTQDRNWKKAAWLRSIQSALQAYTAERHMVSTRIQDYYPDPPLPLQYAFAPRIVLVPPNTGVPHFLLRTILSFAYCYTVPISICPHQLMDHEANDAWIDARKRFWRDTPLYWATLHATEPFDAAALLAAAPPAMRFATAVQCTRWMHTAARETRSGSSSSGANASRNVVDHYLLPADADPQSKEERQKAMADKMPGVSGSCHRCPTDYYVRTVNGRTEITVWQDFGTEAPPSGVVWQSHLPGLFLQAEEAERDGADNSFTTPNTWQAGRTVFHEPGSVRTLYEETERYPWEPRKT